MPLTEETKAKLKAILDQLPPGERGKALKMAALNREIEKRKEAEAKAKNQTKA